MTPIYETGGSDRKSPRQGWRDLLSSAPTKGSVLLVEDEPEVRRSLEKLITRLGHECRGAASAEEADHWLSSMHFDVMLLDIQLPRMNGLEFLRWSLDRDPEMAVIMLTGVDDPEMAVRCIEEGARTYFVKPPDPDFLRLALRDALALRSLLAERNTLRGGDGLRGFSP